MATSGWKPGGRGTSTLNVRAQYKAPICGYAITVTATSGSVSHSMTMAVKHLAVIAGLSLLSITVLWEADVVDVIVSSLAFSLLFSNSRSVYDLSKMLGSITLPSRLI